MTYRKTFILALCLALAGCSSSKPKPGTTPATATPQATAQPRVGAKHGGMSEIKHNILTLARLEWEYFGRQTIVLDGEEESIPHVGKWEDDGEPYAMRVNWYWRSVGRPQLDGNDCREPWSAAFISWIMQEAGAPERLFYRADSHKTYLNRMMADSTDPYAAFEPHNVRDYTPKPGDLICATRSSAPPSPLEDFRSVLYDHAKLHCDIVVEQRGDTLAAIGGNVRNSVSKTVLTLDKDGRVQPSQRRPWFMVLENRL